MLSKIALGLLVVLLGVASMEAARAPRLLGGWRKIPRNSSEAQEAGRKAVQSLEEAKNTAMAYRLHTLHSAQVQIVSGKNYKLSLTIAQTNCTRVTKPNVNTCPIAKTQKCNVVLYVPLQSQSSRLTNFTCSKEKSPGVKPPRRPLAGGETKIKNLNDTDLRAAATFATSELTTRSNGSYRVQHPTIIKATSQVVSGIKYKITMQVSVTLQNGQIKTTKCRTSVWDQAWMTPRYKLLEYNCDRHISNN